MLTNTIQATGSPSQAGQSEQSRMCERVALKTQELKKAILVSRPEKLYANLSIL